MKIIGFGQLYNELEKNNLKNWFKCMNSVCDYIYIFDQKSSDKNHEIYKLEPKAVVYYNDKNDFSNEIQCKAKLLQMILRDHPDTDWIFWLDGDSLLDNRLLDRNEFEKILNLADKISAGGIRLGHLNLWRSDIHYRLDSKYNELNVFGVLALWKNNGKLYFPLNDGLHKPQYPNCIDFPILPMNNYKLIHRGFATDSNIINKYITYKNRGQSGWDLERLLDEQKLETNAIDLSLLPSWFKVEDDENPINKTPIKDIYELAYVEKDYS